MEVTVHNGGRVLADIVPANGAAAFMEVAMDSGGHVLPSNFVSSLTITTADSLGQTLELYNGVRNADWRVVHRSTDRQELTLVVE